MDTLNGEGAVGDNQADAKEWFRACRHRAGFAVQGTSRLLTGTRLPDGDGTWLSWEWDGTRLTAETDRYGVIPLFYRANGDSIIVARSLIEAVRAGAPVDFDGEALAVFRFLGVYPEGRTPLRGVSLLPPGARLHWDGTLSLECPERPIGRDRLAITRDEAIDRYIELFREAVRRRLTDEPFAVPLSGGRDSRHILLELLHEGARPAFCVTGNRYPPTDSNDPEVARAVAAAVGVKHAVVSPLPRFEAERRKNEAANFASSEHAWFVPVADYVLPRAPVMFDGLGGDVLSASLFQDEQNIALYRAGRLAELARQFGVSDDRQRVDPLLSLDGSSSPEVLWRAAPEIVQEELRRYQEATNPVTMFYFWSRTRRGVAAAPFGVFAKVRAVCPYLDADLFDFLAALPPELTIDKRFHTDAIARAFPEHERLPYATLSSRPLPRRNLAILTAHALTLGLRHPRWIRNVGAAAYATLRHQLDGGYRARHSLPDPFQLAYAWQLGNLADLRMARECL
jgi:hypothetical protein